MGKAVVVGIVAFVAVGTFFLKKIFRKGRRRDDLRQTRTGEQCSSVLVNPQHASDMAGVVEQKPALPVEPHAAVCYKSEPASSGAVKSEGGVLQDCRDGAGRIRPGGSAEVVNECRDVDKGKRSEDQSLDQTWDLIFGVTASEVQVSPVAPLTPEEFEARFGADSDFEQSRKQLVDEGKSVYLEAELAVELSIAFDSRSSSINVGEDIFFEQDVPVRICGDLAFLRQARGVAHMALPASSMEDSLGDDDSELANADLAESGEVISPHERPQLDISRSDADELEQALRKIEDLATDPLATGLAKLPNLRLDSTSMNVMEDVDANDEHPFTSAWDSSPDTITEELDLPGMIALMEEFVEKRKPGNSGPYHWQTANAVTMSH